MEKKQTDDENINISTTTYESKSRAESVFKNSEMDYENYMVRKNIDKINHKYPYCIVWTPLPIISWFLPFIGHTGICS